MVGRFCGSVSVAAVGSTGAITNLMVNFFIGLSVGAGVSVAHGLGSREDTVVSNTVHTALPTAIFSGRISPAEKIMPGVPGLKMVSRWLAPQKKE